MIKGWRILINCKVNLKNFSFFLQLSVLVYNKEKENFSIISIIHLACIRWKRRDDKWKKNCAANKDKNECDDNDVDDDDGKMSNKLRESLYKRYHSLCMYMYVCVFSLAPWCSAKREEKNSRLKKLRIVVHCCWCDNLLFVHFVIKFVLYHRILKKHVTRWL